MKVVGTSVKLSLEMNLGVIMNEGYFQGGICTKSANPQKLKKKLIIFSDWKGVVTETSLRRVCLFGWFVSWFLNVLINY